MKIYLLDINKDMTDAWKRYFKCYTNVEIINDDFATFMNNHPEIDTVVSPANSFGLMDGGYDLAITNYFGKQLMEDVQLEIIENWHGEQPVGTSISVPIKDARGKNLFAKDNIGRKSLMILIHTPTMRTPEVINDYRIIYQCMRTTLIEAEEIDSRYVVIPAFGGSCGQVPYDEIARLMCLAYTQICFEPEEITWKYAMKVKRDLENK